VAPMWKAYAGLRPAEELYDNRRDPNQMINLADKLHYTGIKRKLDRKLSAELVRTGDPRATGHGDIIDNYPDRGARTAEKTVK